MPAFVMEYQILPMLPDHWPAVREIYGEGIATGNATFETEFPSWEKWDTGHRKDCRLVALESIEPEAGGRVKAFGLGCPEPGIESSCVSGSRRSFRLRCSACARTRRRQIVAASLGAGVGSAMASGRCRRESFRKMPPASRCTSHADSAKSASGADRKAAAMSWRDVKLLERRSTRVGV